MPKQRYTLPDSSWLPSQIKPKRRKNPAEEFYHYVDLSNLDPAQLESLREVMNTNASEIQVFPYHSAAFKKKYYKTEDGTTVTEGVKDRLVEGVKHYYFLEKNAQGEEIEVPLLSASNYIKKNNKFKYPLSLSVKLTSKKEQKGKLYYLNKLAVLPSLPRKVTGTNTKNFKYYVLENEVTEWVQVYPRSALENVYFKTVEGEEIPRKTRVYEEQESNDEKKFYILDMENIKIDVFKHIRKTNCAKYFDPETDEKLTSDQVFPKKDNKYPQYFTKNSDGEEKAVKSISSLYRKRKRAKITQGPQQEESIATENAPIQTANPVTLNTAIPQLDFNPPQTIPDSPPQDYLDDFCQLLESKSPLPDFQDMPIIPIPNVEETQSILSSPKNSFYASSFSFYSPSKIPDPFEEQPTSEQTMLSSK